MKSYVDIYLFADTNHTQLRNLLLVLVGSFTLALLAQISIPLPFSPVPITAQSLGVLVIGALYGRNKACATVGLYLLQGAAGLPVFAQGMGTLAVFMGPTGGYLIGFFFAAMAMGYLSEQGLDRKLTHALLLFFIGHLIIFSIGLLGLSLYVPTSKLLALGFYPFALGLMIKTVLASLIVTGIWKKSAS